MESHVIALSGCYLISTCMYVKSTAQITSVSMPSRAVTSFLHQLLRFCKEHGILRVNALSGCYLISTITNSNLEKEFIISVNALSGCYLISTRDENGEVVTIDPRVSMPSRAVTSFLHGYSDEYDDHPAECQCPLGLLPHFYRKLK